MKLKILAVDDEEEALKNIIALLKNRDDYDLIDTCNNGKNAITSIIRHKPHIVLLDIQMPELTGFDIIKSLEHIYTPLYIFVTAYNQYAIEAFDVNAIDYLLKPFTDLRFYRTLERARNRLKGNYEINSKVNLILQKIEIKNRKYFTRLTVKASSHVYFIEVNEIINFNAENHYIKFFIQDGTAHLIRETLHNLEKTLDPSVFFRAHRSSIINLNQIIRIEPYFNGALLVTMKNEQKIRLPKNRKESLKAILNW